MFVLKPISPDSVEGAMAKAERYRLLNEPNEAESICRDILDVDPANREARISLILALTDEFPRDDRAFAGAMAEIAVLESAYDRAYYGGIAWERKAKAFHETGRLGSVSTGLRSSPTQASHQSMSTKLLSLVTHLFSTSLR